MTRAVSAPQASLVILNYDGRELLEAHLPSVLAQDHGSYEVVVVDNGSTDGSVALLRERWPQVRVVALERNVGVTAALNVMVREARGAYVGMLNNDVDLAPDWLRILIGVLEADPEAAAAQGKLLRYFDRGVIDRAGDVVHTTSACFGRGAGEPDAGQYDAPADVFSAGGAAALYRRSAFDRVGFFDEDFFAYAEDVDWGFRAQLAGLRVRYEPAALGYHRGGATLGEINPFSLYHLRRNQLWMVLKNYPGRSLLRHGPAVVAFNLVGIVTGVRAGHGGVVWRAYRDALRGVPGALRKRRAIQRSRAIGAGELERMLAPAGRFW